MDEEKFENEAVEDTPVIDDNIREKTTEVLEKLRTQSMLLGARAMCVTIANMIDAEMKKPGKRTMNDMKRIVKHVRDFCQTAVDHPVETPKFGQEEKTDEA